MNIALIGCGYVADYYVSTLKLHPELKVMGVTDLNDTRAVALSQAHGFHRYPGVQELLADGRVQLVLNLTNPRSHYEISKKALDAGKHVYSEKPLSMRMSEAVDLVETAERHELEISSAPCSVLGETAQTLWHQIRRQAVGPIRAVYAEMDDGMVHRMPYAKWKSLGGHPWPYRDEFEVGCTVEHAGYYLTWLAAWFGPASRIAALAAVQVPEKVAGEKIESGPDLTVACVQFVSGVVARLTCSIIAPHDHSLRVIGDEGVLATTDCWNYRSPVTSRRMITIRRKAFMSPIRTKHKLVPSKFRKPVSGGAQEMDFARGPAALAAAIKAKRPPLLSARFCLHVNEMTLAIHNARAGSAYEMTTTFDHAAMQPNDP